MNGVSEARGAIRAIKADQVAFSRGKMVGFGAWSSVTGAVAIGRYFEVTPLLGFSVGTEAVIGVGLIVLGFVLYMRGNARREP